MEVKPGYKQTEVGVIPEEWEVEPSQILVDFWTVQTQNAHRASRTFGLSDRLCIVNVRVDVNVAIRRIR